MLFVPNANDEEALVGNYNGIQPTPITPLKGIQKKVGKSTKVLFVKKDAILLRTLPGFDVIPTINLFISDDKKVNGLDAEYFDNSEWKGTPVLNRIDSIVDYKQLQSKSNSTSNKQSIRWSCVPEKSGEYYIGGYGYNGFKFFFEDSLLTEFFSDHHPIKTYKKVKLTEGKAYKIRIDFYSVAGYSQMQLVWSVPDLGAEDRAVKIALQSDAVLMFMGLSPRLEGEEMNVPVKGFAGGDRTSLDLPEVQEKLIQKITALGKPVVLILLNGSSGKY